MTEMRARLVDKDGNPLGTASNPLKISGDVGGGVPDGGTTGQVLQKKSDADQDVEWGDGSGSSTAWGSITGTLADQTDLDTALSGKVPTTRTVNNKALSSDISLTASDVGAATTTDITYETLNTNGDVGTTSGTVCAGDDPRLSDSRTPTSHGNEAHSSTFLTEIDIHGATPETAIADDDEILIYDASASANRRMTRSNFLDGISAVGAFTDLTDTPASYSGYDETYYVRVNAASNALEFATVPSSYTLPTASADTLGGVKIGSGITITDGVISTSGGGGITWNEVTGTAQAAAADNGYICNNAALVTVTLPSTCAVGKTIRIAGKGTGLWKIAQNAGQQIIFGNKNSTSGTPGYIAALYQYDSVELLCITADTVFSVTYAVGDLDVV